MRLLKLIGLWLFNIVFLGGFITGGLIPQYRLESIIMFTLAIVYLTIRYKYFKVYKLTV